MDSRILIAIILSLGFVFLYQELVLKRIYPPPSEQPETAAPTAKAGPSPGTAAPPTVAPAAPLLHGTPLAALQGPVRNVEIETSLYRALLTTQGGRLASFQLKQYRASAEPASSPYEMVYRVPGGPIPLGLVLSRGQAISDDSEVVYATDAPPVIRLKAGSKAPLKFVAETSDGLRLTKTFTFDDSSYLFTIEVEAAGGRAGPESLGLTTSQPLEAHEGYYDIPEIQAEVGGKVLTAGEKQLNKGVAPVSGQITYAGIGDRYFLAAFLPESPTDGTLTMGLAEGEARALLLFNGTRAVRSGVYMGPKALDILEGVNPALSKAIDFGWMGILGLPFLRTLKLFHHISSNWGMDIILLTVLVRIVLLPMTIKGQRSAMRLQRLQPQMERLRQKYKDDSERLNREMIDLYKRNHVNPLGGCAPMLVQFPIFIGLYEALLNAVELRHAPFVGWIRDLSAPDCLPIPFMAALPFTRCHGLPVLVLAMGASTFLQQWMSPASPDPNQQRMMMLSPIIFTLFFINFPAGLSLYYFASNLLGIIQQFFLNRELKQATPTVA